MAKIMCASVECKHYSEDGCKARRITFNEGHIHTVHQGFKHVWYCKSFEEDEYAGAVRAYLGKVTNDANNHN